MIQHPWESVKLITHVYFSQLLSPSGTEMQSNYTYVSLCLLFKQCPAKQGSAVGNLTVTFLPISAAAVGFFCLFFFLNKNKTSEQNIAKLFRICSALSFHSILQVLHTDKRIESSEILRGTHCLKSVVFSFLTPVLQEDVVILNIHCTLYFVYCYQFQKDRIFMILTIDTDLSNFQYRLQRLRILIVLLTLQWYV